MSDPLSSNFIFSFLTFIIIIMSILLLLLILYSNMLHQSIILIVYSVNDFLSRPKLMLNTRFLFLSITTITTIALSITNALSNLYLLWDMSDTWQ